MRSSTSAASGAAAAAANRETMQRSPGKECGFADGYLTECIDIKASRSGRSVSPVCLRNQSAQFPIGDMAILADIVTMCPGVGECHQQWKIPCRREAVFRSLSEMHLQNQDQRFNQAILFRFYSAPVLLLCRAAQCCKRGTGDLGMYIAKVGIVTIPDDRNSSSQQVKRLRSSESCAR